MWPKVLIELVPHIARLVPMADKFLSSRGNAPDEATQQAMAGLRDELAQTGSTHAALYRQLNEQADRISEVVGDTRATKAAVVMMDSRMEHLEKKLAAQSVLLLVSAGISVVLLVLVVLLLVRH